MRTRGRLLGAFLGALSLAVALTAAPSFAFADEAQINVSVPTTVPCYVKHDGTVITPSEWKVENVGSEEVSLGDVSVSQNNDEAISLSASSSVAGGNKSAWFSYKNGSTTLSKTDETLAPGKTVSVDRSVGKFDAKTNANALKAATRGAFALATVDFPFGQKQAFAVWYSDNTAGLYKRFKAPSVGDTFDGRTVTRVTTGIEDMKKLFAGAHSLKSVTAADKGIRPKTTESWLNGCWDLTTVDFAKLDTSRTTNMASTFQGCNCLSSVNIEGWDTSSVTNMQGMFNGCFDLTSLNLTGWDTSKVTNTSCMFQSCSSLTSPKSTLRQRSKDCLPKSRFLGMSQKSTCERYLEHLFDAVL